MELVRRRLAESRAAAVELIESGRVVVGGAPAGKPARLVGPDEPVALVGPAPRYVSRGGTKLEAALATFCVEATGRSALDAGASTGGFTDCLLQAGAARVVALDVGRGQLHPRLRQDARVVVRERTDLRAFAASGEERFELVVADLSFISLRVVAPALAAVSLPGADLVVLVKPQFEAGRAAVSRGKGVIRAPRVWEAALEGVASALVSAGTGIMGAMASPLTGASGNAEFLLHGRKGVHDRDAGEVAAMIAGAVSEAEGRSPGADPAG